MSKITLQNIPIAAAKITTAKPWKIIEANEDFYLMYGLNCDENINSEKDFRFVAAEHEDMFEIFTSNIVTKGEDVQDEFIISDSNGLSKWVLIRGGIDVSGDGQKSIILIFIDIEDKKQIETNFYYLKNQYQVMEQISDGVPFDYDVKNNKVLMSFGFSESYKENKEEHSYIDFQDVLKNIHPIDRMSFENEMIKASYAEIAGSIDCRYNTAKENENPQYIWYRILYRSILGKDKKVARIVGRSRNVESDMVLKDKVRRDPLTKLFNKVEVKSIVEDILVKESNRTHVLFVIDIDNFKGINDTFGHTFGDTVISDIAMALKDNFRGDDVVGRVGGDEFLVLMRDVNAELAVNKARTLCDILRREYTGGDVVRHTSTSIGIAVSGVDGNTYDELFEKADHAMYRAKKDGKNGFKIAMEEDKGPIRHKEKSHLEHNEIKEKDRDFLAFALNILSHARNIDGSLNLLLDKILTKYNFDLITVCEEMAKDEEIILTNCAGDAISIYDKTVFPRIGILNKMPEAGLVKVFDGTNIMPWVEVIRKQGVVVSDEIIRNIHFVAGKFEYVGNRHGICCFYSFEKDKKWTESELSFLGELSRTIGVFASLRSRIEESNANIRKIQNKDQLTGLLNLDVFKQQFKSAVYENYDDKKLCLCYFDINNFGCINENYGYQVGDKILRVLSRSIIESEECLLGCRLYSDFFLLLLQGEDEQELISCTEKKQNDFVNLNNHQYPNSGLAVTTGLYFVEDRNIDIDIAIENVNLAWKKAKNNSGARIVVFEERFRTERGEEQHVIGQFYESLYRGDFMAYFQPKFNLVTNEVYGAEALARWKRVDGRIVPPIKFINSLEKIGYITDLDFYIFEETLKAMVSWKKQNRRPLVVSMNFSGKHFESDGKEFMKRINSILRRYPVDPSLLEIEITEGVMVKNYHSLIKSLEELRERGFRVAVDDFGTGYSSLSILMDIPADVVKIDKSFLDKEISEKNIEVLKSIGNLVETTGREIVFEGVETEEQRQVLAECGFLYGQGYLCNKPICQDEFEKLYL